MKRLTKAQSELIDAFLAEHAARVSTAQLEKDFLISEVFSAFTEPVVYQGHEATFVLCGGTAVSKAHRFTERISEDVDLRVSIPEGLSGSAQKRLLSRVSIFRWIDDRRLPFARAGIVIGPWDWQKRPRALRVRPKCVAPTTSYY